MLSLTELWYRAKKAYSIYPGIVTPVSGPFLKEHYARRRRERGLPRAMLDVLVGLGFHAWIPFRALATQRRLGLTAEWRRRASRIAHQRFADPNDIALFRIQEAGQLDGYIRRFEDAGLNQIINPLGWRLDCVLMDKIAFYARCQEHDLTHPPVVATWRSGEFKRLDADAHQPLLLKPARGEGGRGVKKLDPPEGASDEELDRWLREAFAGCSGPWLIQHRIAPHPHLLPLALGALPTARITTILDAAGEPEVCNAVLRFPSDPTVAVDNMKAGGLLSPVDLDAGTLGLSCQGYGGTDHEVHPVTGAPIVGARLPDWEAAKALVVDAHRRAFLGYTLIGWDVGFSPAGPVLVEGNGKPGVLMPQRSGRRGLGGQRYGELLAVQLARH